MSLVCVTVSLCAAAIDERVESVVRRYRGEFLHYDVNNEMLHGGYFEDTYGVGAVVRMFQKAHLEDPQALLFLNDYNAEDGMCSRYATPTAFSLVRL